MKKRVEWIIPISTFFLGAVACYLFTQYHLLEIDVKVSVPGLLVSLMTATIGIYIATGLKRKQNRDSNLHNYLQKRFEKTWELYYEYGQTLEKSSRIKVSSVAKYTKDLTRGMTPLKQLFKEFNIKEDPIEKIFTELDELESLISACPKSANTIDYTSAKGEIIKAHSDTNSTYIKILKSINKLS